MNRLLVSAAALLFGALPAHAQSLVSGKVQTGTPSYVNDQNVPLSLDATGALRTTGGSGGASTGSVTPAGTNGTQAQAVQGINGGVPVGVSATSLPLPAGAATEATQQGVATSNAAINAATGSQSDAATGAGANTSIIGALRAIRDKLLTNVAAITFVFDGSTNRQLASTTTGALAPPTAASGKIADTSVSLTANTSTTLVAARATPGDRISIEIQCDGTAVVGVDMKGGTLTSATAAPRVIPASSYPIYNPPVATQTAITAYTGTPQTCRVTEYLR